MFHSVAICTWNRAALLRQTLENMTKLLIPPGVEWELLVVNNNCSDATDEVIDSFSARLPIRRVFEAKPGLSNARNAAVRQARGEYVLWTDDDICVEERLRISDPIIHEDLIQDIISNRITARSR